MLKALELVAPILPTPIYWHDVKGVVLGVNEHCVIGMGAKSANDIIGKTPYEFYPKEIAEQIFYHHQEVIRTGRILSQDERIEDITSGEIKYFRNTKSPLYDEDGKIIGIIGSAIEITAEKELERQKQMNLAAEKALEQEKIKSLEAENNLQNIFLTIVGQAVHDIGSPLYALRTFAEVHKGLDEQSRIELRDIVTSIHDITSNLLNKYKSQEDISEDNTSITILPSIAISEVIATKKYEYQGNVIFPYEFTLSSNFSFINIKMSEFKRMLSNLINNAVEASVNTDNTIKKIETKLDATSDVVIIQIIDYGCGMLEHVKAKILQGLRVTEGKINGHGIGFTQIMDTLKCSNGQLDIKSIPNQGTIITLTFPKVKKPDWCIDRLEFKSDNIIIVIDDNGPAIQAWQRRFLSHGMTGNNMHVRYYVDANDMLKFYNSLSNEEKLQVYLLTDYELLNQGITGLELITQTKVTQAVLVTSHYADNNLVKAAIDIGIKILPKFLATEIPIMLN